MVAIQEQESEAKDHIYRKIARKHNLSSSKFVFHRYITQRIPCADHNYCNKWTAHSIVGVRDDTLGGEGAVVAYTFIKHHSNYLRQFFWNRSSKEKGEALMDFILSIFGLFPAKSYGIGYNIEKGKNLKERINSAIGDSLEKATSEFFPC